MISAFTGGVHEGGKKRAQREGPDDQVGLRHLSALRAAGIINSRYFTAVFFHPGPPGEGALSWLSGCFWFCLSF